MRNMDNETTEKLEVEETAQSEGSTDETNTETSKSEEDASKQTTEKSGEGSDEYADELAKVKEQLGRAENKIVKLRQKKEDIDPDVLVERAWEKIEAKISNLEVRLQKNSYEKEIASVSSTTSEKELIKFHLENSIKPTGDIEADVRKAKLLANEKKLLATNKELAQSIIARKTMSTVPNFGGAKTDSETPMSDEDKKLIRWAERVTGKKAN